MRKERQNFNYSDFESMQYENEANFKGQQDRNTNRGKRRSNRKRSSVSEGKVFGIGHRRQRKWSW